MKKGMMVMGILIVLSFLALLCAVAPAAAKQTTQTQPTSKQQVPPAQIQIKETVKAKDKFWDLAVDHFVINGQSFAFPNDFNQAKIINVKVGQTVTCQCFYKIKTISIGSITQADAKAWGSGNTYKIAGGLFFPGQPPHQEYKIETRQTPKFTYADIQSWKNQYGTNGNKEWNKSLTYSWTATSEHVGKSMYLHFDVDSFFNIKETDEQNNGSFSASGCVAKFIVTPYKVPLKDMSIKRNK